jgi:hypothetical protein
VRDLATNHRIHVVLDGKDYGMRHWVAVPRVGDHVMLQESKSEKVFFTALVTRITWGVAEDDLETKWPDVNMHVTRNPI